MTLSYSRLYRCQQHWLAIVIVCLFTLLFLASRLPFRSVASGLPYLWTAPALEHGPHGNVPFDKVYIHLDLKGAPPKPSYYRWFFPFLRSLGVDGVLIEYEDCFPYSGQLAKLRRVDHYTVEDVHMINQLALDNRLDIVPLIQTFGHLEYVLKHSEFARFRESSSADDSICPSDSGSLDLIKELIQQIRHLHPDSHSIHIGADEAYHVAEDERCHEALQSLGERPRSVEKLKLRHIARVARLSRSANFSTVFAWNDMFQSSSVEDMKEQDLGSLISPVVWGYAADVLRKGYFPDGLFQRISQVFPKVWFASAFKGANGKDQQYIDINRYMENHKSYVKLYRQFSEPLNDRVAGLFVTGWQRYKHHLPLCELLPVSIPSLAMNVFYTKNVKSSLSEVNRRTKSFLNCSSHQERNLLAPIPFGNDTFFPYGETIFSHCQFNDRQLYSMIMSEHRLLNFKINHLNGINSSVHAEVKADLLQLTKKLSQELSIYYYPSDVKEILSQIIDPLESKWIHSSSESPRRR